MSKRFGNLNLFLKPRMNNKHRMDVGQVKPWSGQQDADLPVHGLPAYGISNQLTQVNQSQTVHRTETSNFQEYHQRLLSEGLQQRSQKVQQGAHRKSMQNPPMVSQNLLRDESEEIIHKVKQVNLQFMQTFKRSSKRPGYHHSRVGSLMDAINSKNEAKVGRALAQPRHLFDSTQFNGATLHDSSIQTNNVSIKTANHSKVRARYARNLLQLAVTSVDSSARVSNFNEYDSLQPTRQSHYHSYRRNNNQIDLKSIRASVNGLEESHVSKASQAAKLHALQKVPRRTLQQNKEFNQIMDNYRMSLDSNQWVYPISSVGHVVSSLHESDQTSAIHGASIDDSTRMAQTQEDDSLEQTGLRIGPVPEWTQVELKTLDKVVKKNMRVHEFGQKVELKQTVNLRHRRAPTKYSVQENTIDILGIMQKKVMQMNNDGVREILLPRAGFFSPQSSFPNQCRQYEKITPFGHSQTTNHRIGRQLHLFKRQKQAQIEHQINLGCHDTSNRHSLPPVQQNQLQTDDALRQQPHSKQPDFERAMHKIDLDSATKSQFNTVPSKGPVESPREQIPTAEELEKMVQLGLQQHQMDVDQRLVHWLKLLQAYNATRNQDLSDLGDWTYENAQAVNQTNESRGESIDPLDWLPLEALARSQAPSETTYHKSVSQLSLEEDGPLLVADLLAKFEKSIRQKQKQLNAEQKQSQDFRIFSPAESSKRMGQKESESGGQQLKVLKKIQTHLETQLISADQSQQTKKVIEQGLQAVDFFVSKVKNKQTFFSSDPQKVRASDAPLAGQTKAGQRENSEVTAFSILNQIKDQSLELNDVKLGDAICEELSRRLHLLNQNIEIRRLVLENNGITEQSLAKFLEAFSRIKNFKTILIKNNSVSWESLQHLERPLRYTAPGNLCELRLINCRIPAKDLASLLEAMTQSTMRRISLVGIEFSSESFELLLDLIERVKSLIELNLSWCKFNPSFIRRMLEILRLNRNLQSLDLSWNNFQETQAIKSEELSKADAELLDDLTYFMVHNRHLKRLNLSHCNLSQPFLF